MKVAIIAPPYPLEEAPSPPLGICYVAAAFEAAGVEVKILDYIVSQYTKEKLANELDSFQPDIVGSTSVTMNFPDAVGIIRDVKSHNPSIITIMGGPHVSFDPVNTLTKYPEIDLLVIGEGEETIRELVAKIKDKKSWPDIKGIAFRVDSKVFITRPRELIQNLDSIPLPARHLLPLSRYLALGFPISIITSRGCPNQCIFCLGRRMVGYKVRNRDANLVVDEIEHIISLGFSRINIADDLFTSDRNRVRAVCDEIQRRGIKFAWTAFARVNTVDVEILTMMRNAGCDTVSFGIESGNPEMLKRIKKGITLDLARKAVAACKEAGVLPHASFIVGLPGESPETLKDTRTFAEALDISHGYHLLAPFPGTTICEEREKYDLEILTDDWSLYDANHIIVQTSKISSDGLQAFVDEIEKINTEDWDRLEAGYKNGTNSPNDNLRVEGFYRMHFVYKILSEDLIENHCSLPLDSSSDAIQRFDLLCRKIKQVTNMKDKVITDTMKYFVNKGYLRANEQGKNLVWQWAPNPNS